MGYENVGKVWDSNTFRSFIAGETLGWADGITLHHTASPSLAQRPSGFKIQHMRNLQSFYQNELGWSCGPQLFVDEDQAFGLSSISKPGTHARSFNSKYIGIEVLGDYDTEDPLSGRGLKCWEMAAKTVAVLLDAMGKSANSVNFHRDDPKTSKTCPGKLVEKSWFLGLLANSFDDRTNASAENNSDEIAKRLESIEWQVREIKKML